MPSSVRIVLQSQSTLPARDWISSGRWLMANAGSMAMPVMPSPSSAKTCRCVWRSSSSVVQACPAGRTYWRSSSQMAQRFGGSSLSGYCVPHWKQMKRVIPRL